MSKKSRETFFRQVKDGSYASKQKEVYEHIWEWGPLSLDALREGTGMPHQTLTSRISNLMDLGIVEQDIDDNFFTAFERHWEENAEKRTKLKFLKWKRQGVRDGWFERMGLDTAEVLRIEEQHVIDEARANGLPANVQMIAQL